MLKSRIGDHIPFILFHIVILPHVYLIFFPYIPLFDGQNPELFPRKSSGWDLPLLPAATRQGAKVARWHVPDGSLKKSSRIVGENCWKSHVLYIYTSGWIYIYMYIYVTNIYVWLCMCICMYIYKYVYVYQYHIAKEGQVFYGRYIHTWMGLSTNKHN